MTERKSPVVQIKNFISRMPLYQRLIEAVGLLIIAAGIVTSVRMNLVGRSLWWDEAALAFSFSQRDLGNLTGEALELIQSAPVGWLYTVKVLTLLLGNTDFVLRIPSMAAYVGILALLFWIFTKIFKVQYPVTCVAFAASFPLLLQYSNMFKPYITDGFFCLLTVIFYQRYLTGRWRALRLGISWAVLIWFSNPVCFVAGGLMLADVFCRQGKSFLLHLREKMVSWLAIGVPLGVSFVVYYFYWLRQTATDDRMIGYWREWNFPLFPTSAEDLEQIRKLMETIFSQFYRLEYALLILLDDFLFFAFCRRYKILIGVYLSFAVTVFASGLKMFPVNKRLWLFVYPLIMMILAVGINASGEGKKVGEARGRTAVIGVILLGCALLNGGIRYYWNAENVYWPGYEVKKEYEYLKSVIEPDERVYVFSSQAPIFDYYNGYDFTELADTGCQVMVGVDPLTEDYDCADDFAYLTGSKKCYVVLGDTWDDDRYTELLFPTLHEAGYFEMVYNEYETPMWYFCQDIGDVKSAVFYEIVSKETSEGVTTYKICLRNTGEAWLNPEFENLQVVSEEGEMLAELPKNIAPGETEEFEIALPEPVSATFHLENEYGLIAEHTEFTVGPGVAVAP